MDGLSSRQFPIMLLAWPEARPKACHARMGSMAELISTKELTKRFDGLVAVNRVNLQVEEGEVLGVIGPNGSGKTTLFNLFSGYFPPTDGSIHFLGKDISKMPPHRRVEMGMARTFQLVSVFDSMTVWENMVLSNIRFKEERRSFKNFYLAPARRDAVVNVCTQSLEMVGLQDKAASATSELSYGDKRMLEIAIALSLRPKLLLLDEPLAGLSDHEINEVLNLIHRVKKYFTLVIIEHKISKILELVNRLSVMNGGMLICEGEPEKVLCDPEVRECYWGKEKENC
jgi:branched-chain amino acid transport system ATP-binding protein